MTIVAPLRPDAPDVPRSQELSNVLHEVVGWLRRFVHLTNEDDYDIISLWIVHTWMVEHLRTTPRLLLDSPVPESGKTTLLEHLEQLGRQDPRPQRMGNGASAALLSRVLIDGPTLLLLDEADRSLSPKDPNTEARLGILNTGYKTGGQHIILVPQGKDWIPTPIQTFAPVAIAGNSPALPDDTRSRCIEIALLPDRTGLIEDSDWEEIGDEVEALRDRIRVAVEGVLDHISTTRTISVPEGCRSRDKERWRPIKRVARLASFEWELRVDELIEADMTRKAEARESGDGTRSVHVELLENLSQFFEANEGFSSSREIVAWLIEKFPTQWGAESHFGRPLSEKRLGQLLSRHFRVQSLRPDTRGPRGYRDSQFKNLWSALDIRPHVVNLANPDHLAQRCEKHNSPALNGDCFSCALEKGGVNVA